MCVCEKTANTAQRFPIRCACGRCWSSPQCFTVERERAFSCKHLGPAVGQLDCQCKGTTPVHWCGLLKTTCIKRTVDKPIAVLVTDDDGSRSDWAPREHPSCSTCMSREYTAGSSQRPKYRVSPSIFLAHFPRACANNGKSG